MKTILFSIILFTSTCILYSQGTNNPTSTGSNLKWNYAGEMNKYKEIHIMIKYLQIPYHDKTFVSTYLQITDKENYSKYYNNEFELNKKIELAIKQIDNEIAKIKDGDIYYYDSKSDFGEYDFNKEMFPFYPVSEKQIFGNENPLTFWDAAGPLYGFLDFYIKNGKDFNGLYMDKAHAEKFIANRPMVSDWRGNYISRKLYLRKYFTVLNEIKKDESPSSRNYTNISGLSVFITQIDVYGDKCMLTDSITSFKANSSPPEPLPSYPDIINWKNNSKLPLDQGWIKIVDKSLTKNNYSGCDKNKFEIHLAIEKDVSDLYKMKFKFRSNACLNFSSGFLYTMTDFNGNKYPLLVTDVSNEKLNNYIIVTVKINRQTLQMLADGGLANVKFQFSPTNENPGIIKHLSWFCRKSDYGWVSWTALKNEAPEYWMDEFANENFKKLVQNILNQ